MKFLVFLLTFLTSTFSYSQQTENYYKLSQDVENYIDTAQVAWKHQIAAADYSFIGDYKNVLKSWDNSTGNRPYKFHPEDSIYWANSKQINAKDFILKQAEKEEIVIINEAHHLARHRIFVKNLLPKLYDLGYRNLGLEALYVDQIQGRNFAISTDGYYINEPEFGNLIHEALKLGFTVFGYEAESGVNGKEREIQQAQNIQNFLAQQPNAKTIILCGFDHVQEAENRSWEKAMAGRLKEFMQIDPYTINQVSISEKSDETINHYFILNQTINEPFALIDPNEIAFNGFSKPKQTDLVIIHPQSKFENEKPTWQTENKVRIEIPQKELNGLNFPLQILAFRKGEYAKNGVPADVLEIKSTQTPLYLYLDSHDYEIIIRNHLYQVVKQFELKVP